MSNCPVCGERVWADKIHACPGKQENGGIISGKQIRAEVEFGGIEIDPFEPDNVNPASMDLRLAENVTMYSDPGIWDSRKQIPTITQKIGENGFNLFPGQLYLLHTIERVKTTKYVPVLDGKSSIGRLGIQIHLTAGYGDPGFDGQYTMEVIVVHPVTVYVGMRFCQMRFHSIEGDITQYNGNYQGESSKGAVPSRSWRQFERGLLYSCYYCKKDAPKGDWGPGRNTCPHCGKRQPTVAEAAALEKTTHKFVEGRFGDYCVFEVNGDYCKRPLNHTDHVFERIDQ